MTQELAEKLVAWYEESIVMIKKEEPKNIFGILRKRLIGVGVCKCAFVNFDMDIFEDSWVKSQAKSGGFWGKPPICAATKEEIIQLLQLRIDILKTFDGE